MKYIFLDVSSTNVGIAVFSSAGRLEKSGAKKLSSKKEDRLPARLWVLRRTISNIVGKEMPCRAYVEAPMGGSRGRQGGRASTVAVISAFGVAVEACASVGVAARSIFPKKWQSVLGLASPKIDTKASVSALVEATINKRIGQDEADAIAMGMAFFQDILISEAV